MGWFAILVVAVILLLLLLHPRQTHEHQGVPSCSVQESREDYSYLYYINRKGVLTYDCGHCRGCIENEAERLTRQGFTVTEIVLGTKYSGDL